MCQSEATYDFEVPGVRATLTVAGREIEGHLTARGRVEPRSMDGEPSTGLGRRKESGIVSAIEGLFGTDSEVDLGDARGDCTLRFVLDDRIVSVHVCAARTGMRGIWLIRMAQDISEGEAAAVGEGPLPSRRLADV